MITRSGYEAERRAEVARTYQAKQVQLFDREFQLSFDTIAKLAADVCGTPMALVCLADELQQVPKAVFGSATTGYIAPLMDFVSHAVQSTELFVIADVSLDERFVKHAVVRGEAGQASTGDPTLCFFAGAPVFSVAKQVVGVLCVIDTIPRRLSKGQKQQLTTLAELLRQITDGRAGVSRTTQTKLTRERTAELVAVRIAFGELKALYERLRIATEIAGLGIWELDLQTQVLSWDPTLFELYDVDPELASHTYAMWRDCIHPADLMQTEEALRAAIGRGERFEALYRAIGSAGQVKWIRAAGVLQFDREGAPISMMGTSWDATATTLAEQALLSANSAAESSNRSKSEFLANMSHEIRTPLTAIIGLTELVLETRLNRQQADYLEKVQASSRALLGILNDILDFSKIEAGRLDVEHAPFQLRQVLDAVMNLFGPEIEKKGLAFALNVAATVPAQIVGDSLRLTQVLNNLVSNAIKFTAHGEIHLKVNVLSATPHDMLLSFSVTDTGIGLSSDQIAGLFQAFSQADGSTSRKYGGTGLGLVISQQLVTLMGGELSVTSELGEGATFSFTLMVGVVASGKRLAGSADALFASSSRDGNLAPSAARFSGLRVLLAEDNDLNRKMVVAFLQKRGAVVNVVSHGGEAVEAVRRQTFDVVLMDVNMPTMDGIEATRRIRALPQGHGLPIVAMTAAVMPEDRSRCLDAGMVDFVGKPINPDELASALQKWAPEAKNDITSSMQALAKTLKSWLPGRGSVELDGADVAGVAVHALLPVALPGFDLATALNRVDGNRDLLAYLLFSFAEDQAGLLDQVKTLLAAKSRASTADFMHALRGVASNLGATALAEAAHRMEREVRVGATLESYPAFVSAVESTLMSIRRFVRPVTTFSTPAGGVLDAVADPTASSGSWAGVRHVDHPALLKLLASLRPYLEAREVIPSQLLQYLRFLAKDDLPGAPLKSLIRQIDNFEHKDALVSIARLANSNPTGSLK